MRDFPRTALRESGTRRTPLRTPSRGEQAGLDSRSRGNERDMLFI